MSSYNTYRRRTRGRGRRRLPEHTALTVLPKGRFGMIPYAARGAARAIPYAHAAELGYQYASNIHKIAKGMGAGASGKTPLTQTRAVPRAAIRKRGRGRPPSSKGYSVNPKRHEKMTTKSGKPARMGKASKSTQTSARGKLVTHPYSAIPKWKRDRLAEYKYDVWQTVLISKSSRLAASNNTLRTTRYPVKLPDTLDGEKTMTCVFTPFCSNYSGIHTTFMRKVNAAGSDLDHASSQPFDVIQNKADVSRINANESSMVDGADGEMILYRNTQADAAAVSHANNQEAALRKFDQLMKGIHLDLVFTASRAFPVKVSVSVVRQIKPAAPYTLTTANKQELCNSVSNKGLDYHEWITEYFHEFTLPGLRVNKKIPTYSVNKEILCNFMQTNAFAENTVSQDMTEAATTQLGLNIHSHVDEIADGNMSSNVYVLIKYRKIQGVQQFTYKQVIEADSDSTSSRFGSASVELPVVTEESFDVPTHDGITGADGSGTQFETGAPLTNNQGDESKASAYLHGKLKYVWGFRKQCEAIPSCMSLVDTSNNYKKPVSLNIDPTQTNNTDYGLYQQSLQHVNIAADTST